MSGHLAPAPAEAADRIAALEALLIQKDAENAELRSTVAELQSTTCPSSPKPACCSDQHPLCEEMGKKQTFYAVRVGRTRGVYLNWAECEPQVKGFASASFKGFRTRAEAEAFINSNTNTNTKSSTNTNTNTDASINSNNSNSNTSTLGQPTSCPLQAEDSDGVGMVFNVAPNQQLQVLFGVPLVAAAAE